MNIPISKESVAIVVVGYNRLNSIKRLLTSLSEAKYPSQDIPLVISIDASGDQPLYDFVENYEWSWGPKYVNIQKERLGLKNHIIQCGDLTKYFKGIILLEDDIFVSPFFYHYAISAISAYGNDDRISQISLYRNETNGFVGLPIKFLENGSDAFLYKGVSSWGECWTEKMWTSFKNWYEHCTEEDILDSEIPPACKKWTRAWSKYFNAYNALTGRYVVYPYVSLTTNFSDAGEHGGTNNTFVQVNLQYGRREYQFVPFEKMVRYDAFCNNEQMIEWLNIAPEDIDLDVYGFRGEDQSKRYLLTAKQFPYKIIKEFALHFRPLELNIKYKLEGHGLFLYDTTVIVNQKEINQISNEMVDYSLQGFSVPLLGKVYYRYITGGVKNKLHRLFHK